jgi:uncharacterized membrane protein
MQIFKRILLSLAALAVIAFGVAVFYVALHHDPGANGSGGGDEKYMFLQQVDTRLQVQNDGDLAVTEMLSYDLGSNAWHGLYQDILLKHDEQIKSVKVARVTGGFEQDLKPGSGIELGVGGDFGTYGWGDVEDPTRRLRVVWNVNDTGNQQFVVRYVLKNAVGNYSDASSLLWDVWGTGWETGVGRLNVGVIFPRKINAIYPRTDGFQFRVSKPELNHRSGTFHVNELPAGNYVQVQATGAPLTGTARKDSDILPEVAKEQAQIDAYNANRTKESAELRDRSFVWFLLWALAGALFGLLVVFLFYLWLGRDPTKKIAAGGTYQYPPEKIPAPVIGKALGGVETENLVSATLLSLLQNDVFRVLPSTTKKEDIGIMNNVGETTYDASKVNAFEQPIANLLQSAIDTHPEHAPDFTKLKKYLSATEAETAIDKFNKALDKQMPEYNLKKTFRGYLRRTVICVLADAIYILALVAILFNGGNDAWARWDNVWFTLPLIGFSSVLFFAALEGNAFYRLKPDQAERVRKWETYQDFFAKMDLSREYPLTVEIWDEALIYAAAFGYAKKVITNMPRTSADGSRVGDTRGLGSIATNAYAASAISSMTSGMSSVTGMASSSSSGGGGSSGGSSGGGGGGGW